MNGILWIVFVLLLFPDKGISVVVPPPVVNLTIECHNFKTVAYWNYSQPSLHPRFTVQLFQYGEHPLLVESCLNITRQHCDVSDLVLRSIQGGYFLNVTAVVGSNQSVPVPSSEFTYNTNMIEEQICSVDFPPVNLSVSNGMLKLQFPHPLNFYKASLSLFEKKQRKPYENFGYELFAEEQWRVLLQCRRTKDLCEGHVPVPEPPEKLCFLLEGKMNNINVMTAKKICLEPSEKDVEVKKYQKDELSLFVSLVVTAVVLVIIAILGILVFRRKTTGHTPFPKFMASVLAKPRLLEPESDATSQVLSIDPRADPEPELPLDHSTTGPLISEEGSRFPIGGFGPGQTHEGSEQGIGNEKEKEKQKPSNSRDIEFSGYDRPHVMMSLEISPGDRVEGYKAAQA